MLNKQTWRPFAGAVFLLTLLSAALFARSLLRIDVLPGKYLIPVLAVETLVLVFSGLLLFCGMRGRASGTRRARRVIGLILCLLLVTGNLFAFLVLRDLDRTRELLGSARERSALVGVYVLKDDAAQTLADTAQYPYGVLGGFEKGASELAVSEIESRTGAQIDAREYATISDAAAALRAGEVRALAVNENHLELLAESESFGGFAGQIRLIDQIEVPLAEDAGGRGSLFGSLLPSRPARTEEQSTGKKLEKSESVILYLSGNDSRASVLSNGRSDVNILMVVDPAGAQILLVNTPRDYYLPNPALGGGMDKLTHCGLFGAYNSMAALEELYGVEIDNYCQINFSGFEKLIDALGGVTLENPSAFYSSSGYYFPAGELTLDGAQALAYGRERQAFGDGDVARGRNLMRLIGAMVDTAKKGGASLLLNYPSILESLEGMFATDLSAEEISSLAKLAIRELDRWDVKGYTVSGSGGMMRTAAGGDAALYVMWPNGDEVARAAGLIKKVLAGERITDADLG